MNNKRRKCMEQGIDLITKGKEILEQVLNDEEMAFDNLSDGLQQTERGENMEENIDILNDVIESINTALENIDDIV